jgi:hypothetical protein|tara:strand:- start:41784 stop:41999 length:216 start_codon:yes stop_codon:yes gene_type:complete
MGIEATHLYSWISSPGTLLFYPNVESTWSNPMLHLLPKRGDKSEWQHTQDYWLEKDELPEIDLDDPIFVYR